MALQCTPKALAACRALNPNWNSRCGEMQARAAEMGQPFLQTAQRAQHASLEAFSPRCGLIRLTQH